MFNNNIYNSQDMEQPKKSTLIILKYKFTLPSQKDETPCTDGKALVIYFIRAKGNVHYRKRHRIRSTERNS